jgi:nitrate reductase NapE component
MMFHAYLHTRTKPLAYATELVPREIREKRETSSSCRGGKKQDDSRCCRRESRQIEQGDICSKARKAKKSLEYKNRLILKFLIFNVLSNMLFMCYDVIYMLQEMLQHAPPRPSHMFKSFSFVCLCPVLKAL